MACHTDHLPGRSFWPSLRPRAPAVPFQELMARLAAVLRGWRQRARERRLLAGLTERELRDIGLTRGDIHRVLYGTDDV